MEILFSGNSAVKKLMELYFTSEKLDYLVSSSIEEKISIQSNMVDTLRDNGMQDIFKQISEAKFLFKEEINSRYGKNQVLPWHTTVTQFFLDIGRASILLSDSSTSDNEKKNLIRSLHQINNNETKTIYQKTMILINRLFTLFNIL